MGLLSIYDDMSKKKKGYKETYSSSSFPGQTEN